MAHIALLLHAHPTMCLLTARPPWSSPRSDWPPQLWLQHGGLSSPLPHGPCMVSPQKKPNLELARGTQPSKTTALTFPRQREAEQEAPGSPTEGLLHHFDVHTAVHAPSKHSGSGHLALSGSGITSMQRLTVPHMNPREGWWQRCCGLVTQQLGKVPGMTVALHLEGMVGEGDGTCSRRERC